MLKLAKHYRSNYKGENVVVDRNYNEGVWHDITERVHNAVENNQISNRAVVLGNGPTRLAFDLQHLKNYSGHLGADTVQTYGCNALYRDFTPDFLIASGHPNIVKELAESKYIEDNIVYTNAIHLLEYPGKFYLIPHDSYTNAGTAALYLAAFDGHKKIFMLGFDGQPDQGFNYNIYAGTNGYDTKHSLVLDDKWILDCKQVFDVYNDVEFIRVTQFNTEKIPELWKYATNFRQISHSEFVLEASL
jgi:hypothetical protein